MKDINKVKRALKEGKTVLGAFVMIPSADLIEILGYAGFDFVIIDTEHGRFNTETLENLIRAADCVDLVPIVRVPNDASMILHVLETGCLGVQIPQVNTKEEASRVVQSVKYYPEGQRGMAFSTRAGNYGFRCIEKHLEISNRETLVTVQVENIRGVENLPEILTVQGIDVIFVGPADLSQSLGLPGQINHPKVQETIGQIASQVTDTGLTLGTYVSDVEMARKWIARGVKYITVSTGTVFKTLQELAKKIRASEQELMCYPDGPAK